MLNTNVRGVFLWLRTALPVLKAATVPSQIVVTSSVMGSRPVAQAGPYCASKYAVNGLVLSLRAELKASGHTHVKCGLICPAGVATPWWHDKARGFAAPDAPPPDTSKFLTPEAVANACVALLEQDRIPCVGPATTRRALRTTTASYNDDKIKALVCFVCGQQRLTLAGPEPPPTQDTAADSRSPSACSREIELKTLAYFRGLEKGRSATRGTLHKTRCGSSAT